MRQDCHLVNLSPFQVLPLYTTPPPLQLGMWECVLVVFQPSTRLTANTTSGHSKITQNMFMHNLSRGITLKVSLLKSYDLNFLKMHPSIRAQKKTKVLC